MAQGNLNGKEPPRPKITISKRKDPLKAGDEVVIFSSPSGYRGPATFVGYVDVYILKGQDGNKYTKENPEEPLTDHEKAVIEKETDMTWYIAKDNPKFQNPNGDYFWGCTSKWGTLEIK